VCAGKIDFTLAKAGSGFRARRQVFETVQRFEMPSRRHIRMAAQNKFINCLGLTEAGMNFRTTDRHYADK
jgi:hypothetical protein